MTDFALSLRRLDVLTSMLAMCRRRCPAARVGFHTNMASEAVGAVRHLGGPIDHVSVLASPEAVGVVASLTQLREIAGGSRLELTAEVGLAPAILHRAALEEPERWGVGADAVLIGAAADPVLASERRKQLERDWNDAFPGLEAPNFIP